MILVDYFYSWDLLVELPCVTSCPDPANGVKQNLLKELTNGSSDTFTGSGCQLKQLINILHPPNF